KADFSVCMYGVVNHVQGQENRVEIYKTLKEVTKDKGYVFLTVASQERFKKEQGVFRYKMKVKDEDVAGFEKGDLRYTRKDDGGKVVTDDNGRPMEI
ncbi:MAG TPA: hypothetical protein DIV86_02780, partial [Alphaproteobacteria bacterium]|nr:hypothetical protein [Alphaproteobacteria bacterium]